MTSDGGTRGRCFSDLPDDILGAIYRLCSSQYDRARFAAVCTSWWAAASWQPKLPALPLLLNSTGNGSLDRKARAYSPEDGRVLHAPLPRFPYGKRIVGCYDGGWVAAVIGWRLDIVNLFTRAFVVMNGHIEFRLPIPLQITYKAIEKIAFSKDPTSEGCILAAMTRGYVNAMGMSHIALCRLYSSQGEWIQGWSMYPTPFLDIAFCNGELYGLSSCKQLYKLGIGLRKDNVVVLISLQELTDPPPNFFDPRYIFELRGKLATAVEVRPVSSSKGRTFRVFELASTAETYRDTWAEVTSLGDHALFLGPGCCKAVRVSAAGMRGEVEGNHIYYSKHLDEEEDSECLARLDLGSCTVYCYESEGVDHLEGIMSQGYYYRQKENGIHGRNRCTWILPPHF